MTEAEYVASIEAIEREANEAVNRLIFKGVKPAGHSPKVDEALREAAIARGNQLSAQEEIERIQAGMLKACEDVDLEYYGSE